MIIAITGGVGSGKSQVMKMLGDMGGITLSADKINAELLCQPEYIAQMAQLFPSVVENDEINKKALGRLVFYDTDAMQKLNALAHPAIGDEIKRRILEINTTENIFIEVPLLVESNQQNVFDSIWLVKASKELCLKRIIMRDLVDEDYAKRIIANQASDKIREEYCTDIIENDGTYDNLYGRVRDLFLIVKEQNQQKKL